MKVYWWEDSDLHIETENDAEREALEVIIHLLKIELEQYGYENKIGGIISRVTPSETIELDSCGLA